MNIYLQKYKINLTLGFVFLAFLFTKSNAQTIRYQQSIRGGFAKASNCLVNVPSASYGGYGQKIIKTDGGVSMSSSSDLILPTGSTIAKAFLYVEGYSTGATKITKVGFKVPGAAIYTNLTNASTGFIGNPTSSSSQFIIDVTAMMPVNGYVSSVTPGGDPSGNGKYSVADVVAYDANNYGYGWTLYVVYTNPASRYRNVTIADVNITFGGTGCGSPLTGPCSTTFNVNGISVPTSGTVPAVVSFTGTYGDVGLNDQVQFGKAGGALTNLTDPTVNSANPASGTDLYNSTIGLCANNNVSIDAAATGTPIAMSGNFTARAPYNTFTNSSNGATNWYSYFYDSDIVDASGILAPSPTPINVTFTQAGGGDVIGGGAYAIAVDIAAAIVTKTIAPSSIVQGTTATYTWKIDNSGLGGLNLTGIGFTDNLPANIKIATPTGAVITGGTGGVITAAAGGTTVNLASLTLNAGQIATMSVDVTNVVGQLNASCATNPLAFTNGFANIVGNTANLASAVTNQCLIVTATVPIELLKFSGKVQNKSALLTWTTLTEQNNNYFIVERSGDGINYSPISDNINGAGSSISTHDYSFTDTNPLPGVNYYRLQQVDFNGTTVYSYAISINSPLKSIQASNVQWKGNNLKFSVHSTNSQTMSITLFDVSGRKVLSQSYSLSGDGSADEVNINTNDIETGIYFLEIESPNTQPQQIKTMKLNGF
jgi:hypothetical protein